MDLANVTSAVPQVSGLAGRWELIIIAIVLVVLAFVVIFMLKNLAANAVIGVAVFLIAKYVLNVAIPVNFFTVLVALLGGLGGVAALLVAAFLGWL